MTGYVEIAERIRAARKARKMSQRQLAERAGIDLRHLVAFENEQTPEVDIISVVRLLRNVGLELEIVEARSRRPTFEDLIAEQNASRDAENNLRTDMSLFGVFRRKQYWAP